VKALAMYIFANMHTIKISLYSLSTTLAHTPPLV